MKLRLFCMLLCILLLTAGLPVPARAAEAVEMSSMETIVETRNFQPSSWLFDGDVFRPAQIYKGGTMTLSGPEGIASLYLIFDRVPQPYELVNEDDGEVYSCGGEGYLHVFLDLQEICGTVPSSVTLRFPMEDVYLNELRIFGQGEVPADVQRWEQAPEEGVDLLVLSAHGDDEQLFFAGVLPYYAGERDYEVQVVYLTSHANYGTRRPHEMLNGLWAVGVTNYPVFGPFPDYRTRTMPEALAAMTNRGYTEEQLNGFVVEQLRHYRPLVALSHDLNGEYQHGAHMLCGHMLTEAIRWAADPEQFPESEEQWGTWQVPKTYLHLYPENPIHMNWDIPLERFNGMTAYQVTKELGFPAHESQYNDFKEYFAKYDRAEDIPKYGPCDYGLYHSEVGADLQKNDFFENCPSRGDAKRMEEEKRIAEQARKEKDAQRRQEAEALKAQRAEEEAARKALKDSGLRDLNQLNRLSKVGTIAALIVVAVLLPILLIWVKKKI